MGDFDLWSSKNLPSPEELKIVLGLPPVEENSIECMEDISSQEKLSALLKHQTAEADLLTDKQDYWYKELPIVEEEWMENKGLDKQLSIKLDEFWYKLSSVEEKHEEREELWNEKKINIEEKPTSTEFFDCVDKEVVYLERFNLELDVELIKIDDRIKELQLN